ncbi:DUF2259 domain-containing protein [uncultured Cohaesibacter sp.]|uniref:DUF2259 domain-containing protein n=1 Tax=uncultured Cohaesibacter sp. TaxID=1002546 RepID=UPI0029C857CC|nr:DUF2259 domain-containing protein [uncultured Cohaesibacter sp.]
MSNRPVIKCVISLVPDRVVRFGRSIRTGPMASAALTESEPIRQECMVMRAMKDRRPDFRGLLIAVALMMVMPIRLAMAGDAAEFRSHGFSNDQGGRYYAFEEFGVQDGSGFPYSNIYIVDLQTDQWVADTPVRVLIEQDNQPLLAARIKAFEEATPLMQHYNIATTGVLMAASPLNEHSPKDELVFNQTIHPMLSGQPDPYRLHLSNIDVQDLNNCGSPDGRVMGFALSMTKPNGTHVDLHDEGSAPKSRGCPERYHLIAVYSPDRHLGSHFGVALVGVFSRGFEGPDLRYIAVPFSF